MKSINWTRKAVKQLNKVDIKDRVKIADAVDSLGAFPEVKNVKSLTNHKYPYRLRVGNYRVFFTADLTVVRIEEVKKRDERTY